MQHGETTMKNSKKPNETQVAINFKHKYSHNNNEYYYEIDLIDVDSGELCITYISDNNMNYEAWEKLISVMDDKPAHGIGISGNFKYKRNKSKKHNLRIINADVKDLNFEGFVVRDEFMMHIKNTHYSDLDYA